MYTIQNMSDCENVQSTEECLVVERKKVIYVTIYEK